MWHRIPKRSAGVIPLAAAIALGACYQNRTPDEAVEPVGVYGGTVVAFPTGYLGYASPFDYGYYGYSPYASAYGYSPYGYGYRYGYGYGYGYGYAPQSLYRYPYGVLQPPVVVYRGSGSGFMAPRRNGGYGLSPWGSRTHRVAVPRGSATEGKSLPGARLQAPPPPRQAHAHYSPPARPAQHAGSPHRR